MLIRMLSNFAAVLVNVKRFISENCFNTNRKIIIQIIVPTLFYLHFYLHLRVSPI